MDYYFNTGRIFSTSVCGLGITCVATNSPSLDAAALPLSTADLTAPTSPRTITVPFKVDNGNSLPKTVEYSAKWLFIRTCDYSL